MASKKLRHGVTKVEDPVSLRARFDEIAPVLERAVEVVGDREDAFRWLGTPVRAIGYATPMSLLATAPGRGDVLAVFDRLEHGDL
jgi:putative toxin-antitoxin system antitoxin component (TIGR02293 family)